MAAQLQAQVLAGGQGFKHTLLAPKGREVWAFAGILQGVHMCCCLRPLHVGAR